MDHSLDKGLGCVGRDVSLDDVAQLKWNLLREDVSLPCAVLYEERVQHNLRWMREFIAAYGMKLAPHGKTTMAPKLFQMQIAGGAWGITLATAQQAAVAHAHGVKRVLLMNELVGKENMAMVARLLADDSFEFYCLVDSAELVEQLGAFFNPRGLKVRVLLEVGAHGGRAGVRDEAQVDAVLAALAKWSGTVELCGVELFEGVLSDEAAIRDFLRRSVAVTRRLLKEKRFARGPAILSGAGSAWYDVVAEEFAAAQFGDAVQIVLRPGCYLTHDVGAYRTAQARILKENAIAREIGEGLKPALQVWAYVQSRPEPGRAIVGLGKRDAAFDAGFPVAAVRYRPGDKEPVAAPVHWKITKMMDQHAYLEVAAEDDVRVGDMIAFDISHPCLTFDKWRVISVVNAEFEVVDVVETFF
jgi:D-serine dehydratase